jgi:selenide, water dikinase
MLAKPVTKELVLIGGGHAHVYVLKSFGMRPVPGVRLTLIARDVETPYSGMLPGFIAGHYDRDDGYIDLDRLARFADVRLIHAEATGLDRTARRVSCHGHPPVRYDLLSIDIGSTPRMHDIPGAADHATPVKPIDRFAGRWSRIVARVLAANRPLRIAVVGGGAGGVELVLAVRHRLRTLLADGPCRGPLPHFALVTRGDLLPDHNAGVRRIFRRILTEREVETQTEAEVVAVEDGRILCADGRKIEFDEVLWTTQAGAAPWLAETGLELDSRGFIAVDATLRSINDPLIFAVGDVAAVLPHPRPKAGVFAVRQGPPLADNLRRALTGRTPRPFKPQRAFLGLISTGDRYAVASRGRFAAEGAWLWRLKDWIDRRWMRQYQNLPAMAPTAAADAREDAMRCGGCGAKVPSAVLSQALKRLSPQSGSAVRIGLDGPYDAAVVEPPAGRLMLQTVDFFRAFVSDPYVFGRIAANHVLGDIYAMGGEPLTALAIACLPPGRDEIVEDDLYHMLRGALDILEPAGACLVGGHSAESGEPGLGFAVTGAVAEDRLMRKTGLRPGDRLILTKPLGTGTLFAAAMRGRAKARWIAGATRTMQQSAGPAAACLLAHRATACTDVTGFGLLGHLGEMLRASGMDAWLDPGAVPVLDGALDCLAGGIVSTLHPANAGFGRIVAGDGFAANVPRRALLFDPQTAGGLLAGVPPEQAEDCLAALRARGYPEATEIGTVEAAAGNEPRVRLAP